MTAIFFTPEAETQAIQEHAEWREHAKTNPDLFWDQLLIAQLQAAKMKESFAVYRWVGLTDDIK